MSLTRLWWTAVNDQGRLRTAPGTALGTAELPSMPCVARSEPGNS
jgi:hypothetical protein